MSHTAWYLARASGVVAWGLLAADVLWGYVLSTKPFRAVPRPAWTLVVHRFLGGLSVVFVGVHIGGLVADTYVRFGPAEILVPFTSRWHPVAVAWGIIGMYLLVAIEATSLMMKRLPRRLWLGIHRLSFGLFVLSTMHFVSAGTDARGHAKVQIAAVVTLCLTVFMFLLRVLSPRAAAARFRRMKQGSGRGAQPGTEQSIQADPAGARGW